MADEKSKPAITRVPIHEIIARRWSPRAFDAAKPVSGAQLAALMEAARWAPSCYGDEPWRFLVWDKNGDLAAWQKAFECLAPGNQVWVKNAALLMLVCAREVFGHNGKPNRWGQYDSGAAAENMFLQAVALELVMHEMGGFDADRARKAFNIPVQFTPMAMIAIGHQAAPDVLEAKNREQELAPRKREPLEEIFFYGDWGVPAKFPSSQA